MRDIFPFKRRERGAPESAFSGRVMIAHGRPILHHPANALDFSERSDESVRSMIGIPPPYITGGRGEQSNDLQLLQSYVLPPSEAIPSPHPDVTTPEPVYLPQFYGDMVTFAVQFAGAGSQLVLQRANTWRTSLLIVNSTVAGNIAYVFDRVADAVSCVPIVPGGNRLFDTSVPQGDLHVFSTGAGIVIIEYMNRHIRQENYR